MPAGQTRQPRQLCRGKRTNTAAILRRKDTTRITPAGYFTADLSVFTGTPPTKPLNYKVLAWDSLALQNQATRRVDTVAGLRISKRSRKHAHLDNDLLFC